MAPKKKRVSRSSRRNRPAGVGLHAFAQAVGWAVRSGADDLWKNVSIRWLSRTRFKVRLDGGETFVIETTLGSPDVR